MTEPPTPRRTRARAVAPPVDATTDSFEIAEAQAAAEADVAGGARIDTVLVDHLSVERGGIGEATASAVEVRLGGIGAVDAQDVFVEWGGVGAARAERVSVEFGGIGAALAGDVRVTQGYAGVVGARDAVIEQAVVRTLVAREVTINRPSAVLVLIAQHVNGDVRPLLDWRGGLAFGLALGLVTTLARLVRRAR